MLLSYLELKAEVQNKAMHPVEDAQVNASSVDVRLGSKLLVEELPEGLKKSELPVVTLREREPLTFTEFNLEPEGEPFLLYPGQFVLAQTIEEFNLPLDISAEFRLKSSGARMGLSHALAVWAGAGWHGSALTLELHNISQHHIIALHHGDRVGQMIFHRHVGVPRERSYAVRGAYNNNLETTAAQQEKQS